MTRTASCACGSLRIVCEGDPQQVALCHCLACQRRTGSSYGIAAFFAKDDVTVHGDCRIFVREADSGFEVVFHFCPGCGSTVFWKPQRRPDHIAVAVGAFADPAFPKPSKAVHLETRHPWVGDL
jgi:hypothetical protein